MEYRVAVEKISEIGATDDEIWFHHSHFTYCARALRGRCALLCSLVHTTWISSISFCLCSSRAILSVIFTAFHRLISIPSFFTTEIINFSYGYHQKCPKIVCAPCVTSSFKATRRSGALLP